MLGSYESSITLVGCWGATSTAVGEPEAENPEEEVDDGMTTYIGYPTGPKDSDAIEVDDESQQGSRHRRGRGGPSVSAIECNITNKQ